MLMSKNIEDSFKVFLQCINARFSSSTIKKLKNHPNFPSLFALSHTLNDLGIENLALQASYEQIQHELPKPLLIHTKYNAFLVIDRLDDEGVYFLKKPNKLTFQDKNTFIEAWSGYTMIVDNETKGLENDYKVNKTKEILSKVKLPFVVFSFIFFAAYNIYLNASAFYLFDILSLINKTLGVIFCIFLLIHLIDKNNLFVKKLCSSQKNNDKVNCSSILDSNAANLFGVFPWSEIGLLYFVSLFIYNFLFIEFSNHLIIAIIAVVISPYSLYSIVYQWKIAKQWCRLCLAVQGVIFLDLILGLQFLFSIRENIWNLISLQNFIPLSLSFLLNTSLYIIVKPLLFDLKRFKNQANKLNKIRLNSTVFSSLLKFGPQLKIDDDAELTPVKFGNPYGKHRLTIITNPSCNPCIEMHKVLFKILENTKNTSVSEVLLTPDNEQGKSYQVSVSLLQLYLNEESGSFKKAISSYYNNSKYHNDFDSWKKTYNVSDVPEEINLARNVLKKHNQWCRERNIGSSPLLFYNDTLLPKEYAIDDLVYFLD